VNKEFFTLYIVRGDRLIFAQMDITEQKKVEIKLKETLDNLDYLVKKRTAELEKAYKSLEKSEKGFYEAHRIAPIGNWD